MNEYDTLLLDLVRKGAPDMDAIVTARVPVEIKEQANGVLKNIGATPTELVNAAYQYVLECEALPKARRESKSSERHFSAEQLKSLQESIDRSTEAVPNEYWAGRSYKEIIAEGRMADYEALA